MKTPLEIRVKLTEVTPMILTYNETPNILRVLDRLTWAKKVLVIDSYSTDGTLEYLDRYPNVEVHFRKFDGFAQQCNFGLSHVNTKWVLSLDADYVLPESFILEMADIITQDKVNGAFAAFRYCIVGSPLKRDNTTPRKVLYKKALAEYHNVGHQHRVAVAAPEGNFKAKIFHDDRKSLSRWLKSQDGYLTTEARKLQSTSYGDLDLADKIRKTKILGPIVMFFFCLIVQGMLFQGWRGWFYALQRTLVETLLAIKLIGIEHLPLEDYTTEPEAYV